MKSLKDYPQLASMAVVLLLLAACSLPIPIQSSSRPATALPATTSAPAPTNSPLPAALTETPPGDTPQENSGPPTAAPLELGETEALQPLASGTELTITEVHMLGNGQGWALGGVEADSQRLLSTSDGGQTWLDASPPIRTELIDLGYAASMMVLSADRVQLLRYEPQSRQQEGSSQPLVVWRTEDGGATWQASQPLRVPFISVEGIDPYWDYGSEQAGWLLARLGGAGMHQHPVALFQTEDGGASWEIEHEPFETPDAGLSSCTKSGMDFGGNGVGLLTISDCPIDGAEVLISQDGGQTWQSTILPAPAGFESEYQQAAGGGCSAHSPQVISASEWRLGVLCRLFGEAETRFSFLYSTLDSGDSWQAVEIPEGPLHFLNPQDGWILGRMLYQTADGGQSWQLRKEVFWDGQFSFIDTERAWAVARSDEGELALVQTQDGADSWQIIEPTLQ